MKYSNMASGLVRDGMEKGDVLAVVSPNSIPHSSLNSSLNYRVETIRVILSSVFNTTLHNTGINLNDSIQLVIIMHYTLQYNYYMVAKIIVYLLHCT